MDVDVKDDSITYAPNGKEYTQLTRSTTSYMPLNTFQLRKEKQYKQQYGDMYFLRLAVLKPAVEEIASEAWADFEIAGDVVQKVDRVLDVRQGQLCWVAGTVYMELALKPNILEDISKDQWIAAPAAPIKYISPDGTDQIMLEDRSGRLRLTGAPLTLEILVTGCIIAVLGTEKSNGDFDVVDIKLPDLAPQPERWTLAPKPTDLSRPANKIALISGLEINGSSAQSITLDMLEEYLLGELSTPSEQSSAAQISRLIICGNSLSGSLADNDASTSDDALALKKSKKYGYDSSAYNPAPTAYLDKLLTTILSSLPVTILPGASDPANASLPQQPIHTAMFPQARAYAAEPQNRAAGQSGWLDSVSNPWEGEIEGWRVLATGGQTVDDIFKYIKGDDSLEIMERMMRWRCCAPTAPDTLWCYPFQDNDPFVITNSPHLFIVGNQPKFDIEDIEGPAGQRIRLIALPKFSETSQMILLDSETLEAEVIKFDLFNSG